MTDSSSINPQPQGVRRQFTIGYRTLVKTTLVNALRAVFQEDYYDTQFEDLRVIAEYSLERANWPSVYIRYDGQTVNAAGVGHIEAFKDGDGVFRNWDHRYFKGSVEFVVSTLSPLDRDILVDTLIEVLSFGRLDPILKRFFWTVYGEPSDQQQSFVSQLVVGTDIIRDTGDSQNIAPWQPEDVLVFETSIVCDIFGAFYNTLNHEPIQFVWRVNQFPYPQGELPIELTYRPDLAWRPSFVYEDKDGLAIGKAEISGVEEFD